MKPAMCRTVSPDASAIPGPETEKSIGNRPPIVMTASDHERLSAFLGTVTEETAVARFLREELDRAEIVHGEISVRNLAKIGSIVKIVDESTTTVRKIKLISPQSADSADLVSVGSALGTALIGLGPGQTIQWCDGKTVHRTTVLEIS
jgi:regulator of nucleoside diphosphate kinase